jgi:predicted regulator of Ras-like GTPase activity (Roadblock/LC7/MglB family)
MASLTEKLKSALAQFTDQVDDLVHAGVVSADGLMLASRMSNQQIPEARLAATAAATAGLCHRNSNTVGSGDLEHVIIKGEKGMTIIVQIPDSGGSVLVATTGKNANLGILLVAVRQGLQELGKVFVA